MGSSLVPLANKEKATGLDKIKESLGQALASGARPRRIKMGSRPAPLTNKEREAWPPSLYWCGQQDSNLHAYAMEPKGDVTSVKVLS